MTTRTLKAVSYARTSSDSKDSVSLESQHKRNRAYADSIGAIIVGEYSEEYTGTLTSRPELNKIRQLIQRREIDAIIVFSADRFARKTSVAEYLLLEELTPNGVALHLSQSARLVNPDIPEDMLLFNIESTFAAYERAKIVERTQRGKRELLENGIWVGEGCVDPYGYRKVGKRRNTTIERVEEELEIIQYIFESYANEVGVAEIARRLTAEKIPAPVNSRAVLFRSTKWNRSAIYYILRNTIYKGVWVANKTQRQRQADGSIKNIPLPRDQWTVLHVPHTQVISDELFTAVQELLDTGKSRHAPQPKHEYLLARCLKCGHCGSAISSSTARQRYSYYYCHGYLRKVCNMSRSMNVKTVDPLVWDTLMEFLKDPAYRMETLRQAQEEQIERNKEAIEMLESADRVKARFEVEVMRLTELYMDGLIDKNQFRQKKAELDAKLEASEEVRKEYEGQLDPNYLTAKNIQDIDRDCQRLADALYNLGDLPFEKRRKLIEAMGITGTVQLEQHEGAQYRTIRLYAFGVPIDTISLGVVSDVPLGKTRKIKLRTF